jgi:hypothetical protein
MRIIGRTFKHFAKNLLNETENIYDRYLWLLNLINEFAAFELKDPRDKQSGIWPA